MIDKEILDAKPPTTTRQATAVRVTLVHQTAFQKHSC